jgi:hypothetical protein
VRLTHLDHVDGPREARLVGVRWVATADEHAARGIHPALDVVVHVLASHILPFLRLALVPVRGPNTPPFPCQDPVAA